jgi:hypothetical protein
MISWALGLIRDDLDQETHLSAFLYPTSSANRHLLRTYDNARNRLPGNRGVQLLANCFGAYDLIIFLPALTGTC